MIVQGEEFDKAIDVSPYTLFRGIKVLMMWDWDWIDGGCEESNSAELVEHVAEDLNLKT